jgi:hypothetical protein
MTVARYYVAEKNKEGGSFPGVPLRDLTEEEFDALTTWEQASIDASPLYRKTPLPKASKPKADKPEEASN